MLKKLDTLTHTDVHGTKKRFMALNRERLLRTQEALRERQRDFLDILALIFHINHPSLPGYVSKDTPVGISDFRPSDRSIAAAKRFAKTFSQKRRASLRYDIYALYLMGSSGTVAYSKKSDFDIWICHAKDLDEPRLAELRQKATLVEEWAATLDLEVHFFLVEPETFSKGTHESMSAESSGSAQHFLLMEEFYRTGLLLAGRYPLWWLVPPGAEDNYTDVKEWLLEKRYILPIEFIDFGPLAGVPAEEFFGAALWQLYKGIDSPYKSVLKLLLMEVYAHEYPNVELLCHRFKRHIYEGETSLAQLDPYIMLYRKIEGYLVSRGEDERLELVRRCFYFKVNEPLSAPVKRNDYNWRREVMQEITQSWAWGASYLVDLDSRAKWKVEAVLKERTVLVKALTYSYQFLSDFAREHAQLATINQRDLNILGRKLYAAFERKAGKVEIINRGISGNLWESHLTFYRTKDAKSNESWSLYNAPLNLNEARNEKPIKRSHSLIELLAWCHFNSMLDSATVLAMHSPDSHVTPRELKEMLFTFQRLFPADKVLETNIDDFGAAAKALQVAVFVNLGIDPLLEYSKQGMHLMTNKTDALSYGGLGENLALSFDLIIVTSWKEVLTSRYTGVAGLFDCLRDYMGWAPIGRVEPPAVSAHCFSFGRGHSIQQRIEELFSDIVHCFYHTRDGGRARYVLSIEHNYFVLSMNNNALTYQKAGNIAGLVAELGQGNSQYRPIVADRYALEGTLFPAIFSSNRPGAVQLYYQILDSAVDVYILDERGSLYYQRMHYMDRSTVLGHYALFFDSVLNRRQFELVDEAEENREVKRIEYYEILVRGSDRLPYLSQREVVNRRRYGMNVQVIGQLSDGDPAYTIYVDDQSFTSGEYGAAVFTEAARHILGKRSGNERYPVYITDLDVTPKLLDVDAQKGAVQTIHYLGFKRRIERQLNEALQQVELTA